MTNLATHPPRVAEHEVLPLLVARWSPRAMSGEPLAAGALARLFEAARWAPSGGNVQPWRFVYAETGTPEMAAFLDLLEPGNRVWCVRAAALVVVASQTTLADGRPHPTHAFDAGAAWMSLALQGSSMGLVVHAMGGFDRARAPAVAGLPDGWAVQCMIAVGRPGRVEDLPERLQAREGPSSRKPVGEIAFRGRFGAGA
ncbi:MAG: nitroreductase family protein [Polyangiaceae bacterium]|nr:nitroreductase family protein [Polyangiaceae bacterium]